MNAIWRRADSSVRCQTFWPIILIWSLSGKYEPEKPRSAA
ncbi:hypothetical protein [Azospirillum melinis]